jgi:NADH-quinone oxidoreductase subunit J
MMPDAITFYLLAALILMFAILVVTARNTVYCVLFLIIDFLAVALLYAAMNSLFVFAIQLLVYAGGIVVLYLFVVMLVNLKRPPEAHTDPHRWGRLGAIMAAAVMGELTVVAMYNVIRPVTTPVTPSSVGLVESVAGALYTDYLIPFEVASMLLLVAMVGAIILARREL